MHLELDSSRQSFDIADHGSIHSVTNCLHTTARPEFTDPALRHWRACRNRSFRTIKSSAFLRRGTNFVHATSVFMIFPSLLLLHVPCFFCFQARGKEISLLGLALHAYLRMEVIKICTGDTRRTVWNADQVRREILSIRAWYATGKRGWREMGWGREVKRERRRDREG